MFPVGIINVCREMIPCGKRFIEGMLSGGSLRSTARLNLDFSYRKSWGMRGGLPSSSPYSYAVMA